MFYQLEKGIVPEDYDGIQRKINGEGGIVDRNYDYGILLNQKLGAKTEIKEVKEEKKPKEEKKETKVADNTKSEIPSELDATWLAMEDLNGMKGEKYSSTAAKKRIAALKFVLTKIMKGQRPNSSDDLGSEQKKIVDNLRCLKNDIDGLPEATENQQKRKSELQRQYSEKLKTGDSNGKISLSTAKAALSLSGKVKSAQKAKN